LSEVHIQYILPVNEPSLEDDWLRSKDGEGERRKGGREREREKKGREGGRG
jgi:hypothetical protein